MPVLTGEYGVCTIGGVDQFPIRNVEVQVSETDIENSGQGDGWESSRHLRNRWRGKCLHEFDENGDIDTASMLGTVGDTGTFTFAPTGDNDLFVGDCRVVDVRTVSDEEGKITEEVEVKGVGEPATMPGV